MGIDYAIIAVSENYVQVMIGLMIGGLGMGLLLPNMNLLLISATPELLRGSMIGDLSPSYSWANFYHL